MANSLGRENDRDEYAARSAREIAQRNRTDAGQPLSPIMKTAATACELARNAAERDRG
jgi:hypothetical protein